MSGSQVVNPAYRVYLAMDAAASSDAASSLKAAAIQLGPAGVPNITQRVHPRKGSSARPPFIALEIGFVVEDYDPLLVEHGVNALFADLQRNIQLLRSLATSQVTTTLIVNINSKSAEHRPIMALTRNQLALLADLGATFELDGHLMI